MDSYSLSNKKPVPKWIASSFSASVEPNKPKRDSSKIAPKSVSIFRKAFRSRNERSGGDGWVEKYSPKSKSELAVHKKKIEQVEEWFVSSFNQMKNHKSKRAPILLLTGPPGTGKSATVHVLAEELSFELQEWENHLHIDYRTKFGRDDLDPNCWGEERQAVTFRNFLIRASKYCSLFSDDMKKAILVEDFPNVFIQDSSVFHSILRKFLVSSRVPAVFVISDNSRGDVSEKHLFPKNIQDELNVTHISFNPVANGALGKVLNRILSEENKKYGAAEKIEMDKFIESCNGDIRNAINLLQFSVFPDSKQKVEKSERSKRPRMENFSGSKDTTFMLFHALGKVLYCKRSTDVTEPELPPHLVRFQRTELISNPEDIFEKTAVSPDGFNLFLHHNYPDFVPDMKTMCEGSEYFSAADAIGNQWNEQNDMSSYAVSLAIRGLMFHLTSEDKSQTRKWRAFYKPDWYLHHRKTQENMVSLRQSFPELRLRFGEQVQTLVLPYMAKMKPFLPQPGQRFLLSTLATFSHGGSSRSHQDTLLEEDAYCIIETFKPTVQDEETTGSDFEQDEEVVIEEFDY